MKRDAKPHVFVSYVREDHRAVERLCAELRRNAIEVWLDREKIRPGERWQIAIRRAIEGGAFFIACFSTAYGNRDISYMNVELTIAIDQLRSRPADRAWFIPILLEGGKVPERPIGGGETLRDIQWVDLAEDWPDGVRRILSILRSEVPAPPSPAVPRELQTLVVFVSDLVGSSSAAERLGNDDFRQIISQVGDALRRATGEHHGLDVRFSGDGMLATFESAPEAISCALAIQTSMSNSDELRKLKMRIGLSAGPLLRVDADIADMAVTLASRVCSLAEGGQILISESVRLLGVGEGVQLRELGPVLLRGFSERIRLYEVRRA